MALHRSWLATGSDGLIRADQVIGIGCHQTPRISGKISHWLLIINLAVPAGSGTTAGWDIGIVNRTLCQTAWPPLDAPAELALLLARLDEADAAGIVAATVVRPSALEHNHHEGRVSFEFTAFGGVGLRPADRESHAGRMM